MSFDADTEVPAPLIKSKSHGYDKPSSHQKHLAEQCDDKRKKSDEKQKKKKHEYNKPNSLENGCENSRIYQRLSSTGKSSKNRPAGYDIPKDTINEAIIRK